MRRVILVGLMVPGLALAGGPTLSVEGECPGPVDISVAGLTPGGNYAFLFSMLGEGSTTIPSGPCAGTVAGLAGARRGFGGVLDGAGMANFSPDVPDSACGISMQVLDVSTCTLTNIADFSAPGGADDCFVVDDQDYSSFYGLQPSVYVGDPGTYEAGNWSGHATDSSGYDYTFPGMAAGDYYVWVHAFDHEGGGYTDKSYGQWDDPGTYDDTDPAIVWSRWDEFGWIRSEVQYLDAGDHTFSFGSRVDGNYYTISWDQLVVTTNDAYTPVGIVDPSACSVAPEDSNICADNPQWKPVECVTGEWVWSSNRSYLTVEAADAARTLWAHYTDPNCSLDGTGWVSLDTFEITTCDTDWYHIGGRYTGDCGGHDGNFVQRLTMGDDTCFNVFAE